MKRLEESYLYIKEEIGDLSPKVSLILGSGFGDFVNEINVLKKIRYQEIPHFPSSSAPGHVGNLVFGYYKNLSVAIMQGRFHYYEGYSMDEITFPIRVLKSLGTEVVILTNASGGINLEYTPGDLVVIQDHINYSGINPLVGSEFIRRKKHFIDMTYSYDFKFRKSLEEIFLAMGIKYREGVYLYTTGPSYETPSEIKAFRSLGADCVGMSTVPEVIVARDEEMRVVGLSCISNMAAGILDRELTEEEVLEITASVDKRIFEVLRRFLDVIER